MKNKKGITLIALIITIIVLLILAGVSIALVVGDNGIANKALKAKSQSTIGDVKETAAIITGEYQVENEGENPSARYIIEGLIAQGKITASQVVDYGDITGIGRITVENETITITGAYGWKIFVQNTKNQVLPRFYAINEPYLSPAVGVRMKLEYYNNQLEGLRFYDGIYRSNESDIIDYDVKIKNGDDDVYVDKSHVHQDGRYWWDYWYCDDADALEFFESYVNSVRPHLLIDDTEVNYEGIRLTNSTDGKNHFYIPFLRNGQTYAIEVSLGNNTDLSEEQFVIYNYGLYNGDTITNSESYNSLNIVLKYDDGRVYQKTSKEFVVIVYELLDHVVPKVV